MTLEELIAKVETSGLRVANLFQFYKGEELVWRCNLYKPEHQYEFADGASPSGALIEALDKALNERRTNSPRETAQSTLTLADLGL